MIYYYNIDNPLSGKGSFGFDGDYRPLRGRVVSATFGVRAGFRWSLASRRLDNLNTAVKAASLLRVTAKK